MKAHPTPPGTIGQRVKLIAPSPLVTLRSPFGTIVRDSDYGGYVIVRLDEPAIYHGCTDGGIDPDMPEIVEHPDNMEPA